MGIQLKNTYGISLCIIWRWAVLCKKQDGGWIKICEIFSGKSLKEDLSIDTTFDRCYFFKETVSYVSWVFNGHNLFCQLCKTGVMTLLYIFSKQENPPTRFYKNITHNSADILYSIGLYSGTVLYSTLRTLYLHYRLSRWALGLTALHIDTKNRPTDV